MYIYDVIKTLNLHMYCSDVVQSIAADSIKTNACMHVCECVCGINEGQELLHLMSAERKFS